MEKQLISDLMTISEVAQSLKVHQNTLRKWDKNGILKAVRFGQRGDRRYRKEDIEKFLASEKKQVNSTEVKTNV